MQIGAGLSRPDEDRREIDGYKLNHRKFTRGNLIAIQSLLRKLSHVSVVWQWHFSIMSENQQDQGINEGYDVCCRCHIIAQRGEPLYLLTVCVPCWDEVAARTKDAKTKQKQRLESKVNQVQLQAAGSDHAQDVQLPVGVPDQTQPLAPPTAVPNEAEDVHPTAAVSEQADDVQPPPVAGPVLGSEIVEPVAAAANDNQVQDEDESYQGPVGSSSPRLDLDLSTGELF